MRTRTILQAADDAQWVLDLACSGASSLDHWKRISQLACNLNRLMAVIEQDDELLPEFQQKAAGLRPGLRLTMQKSCQMVEALGGFGYRKEGK